MVKTKYEIIEKSASSFGGLHPVSGIHPILGLHAVSELLESIQFNKVFSDVFGKYRKVRKYDPADNLKLLIAAIFCGGERLSDVNRLNIDSAIPELFGNSNVPYDTTIRNDLKHIGQRPAERQELLFRLNEKLLKRTGTKTMTIDMDGTATPVEGHQTNAKKGYCPEAPGSRCFQHLLVLCDEMDSPLAIETRPGNTHCANGAAEMIGKVLERFSPQMESILVRDDAGFYSDEILELYESYHNVEYEVKAAKFGKIASKIDDYCFKTYHGSKREYAVYEYTITGGKPRTYYVERERRDEKLYLFDGCLRCDCDVQADCVAT